MGYRSSGNLTVDAMGSIAISGNVIPEEWYKHILKPTTGKPYLLAITILADLVYWHRPTEVRDERDRRSNWMEKEVSWGDAPEELSGVCK